MLIRNCCGMETVICDNGQKAELFYYLIREQCNGCESYGAEIVMHRDEEWESAVMRNVTTSPARMQAMVEQLKLHTVTPCTLQEIVLEEMNKY